MFTEEDWELINEMAADESQDSRLGKLLAKIVRWIENEDTRALEASEY